MKESQDKYFWIIDFLKTDQFAEILLNEIEPKLLAGKLKLGVKYLRIFLKISVVIIIQLAEGLIVTSPVTKPTSWNSSWNSRYFWFESALIGVVYITRCLAFSDFAMAYSATTVLPAEVCALTRTDWLFSMHNIASRWNGSNVKVYVFAGGQVGWSNGCNVWPG